MRIKEIIIDAVWISGGFGKALHFCDIQKN